MEPIIEQKPIPKKKLNKKLITAIAGGLVIVVIISVAVALILSRSVSFNNPLTPSSYSAQDSNPSVSSYTIANPPVSFAQYATQGSNTLDSGEQLVLFNYQLYTLDVNTAIAKKVDFEKSGKVANFKLSHDKKTVAYVVNYSPNTYEVTEGYPVELMLYNFATKQNTSIEKITPHTNSTRADYFISLIGFSNTDRYLALDGKIYDINEQKFINLPSTDLVSEIITDWNSNDTAFVSHGFRQTGDEEIGDIGAYLYTLENGKLTQIDIRKHGNVLAAKFASTTSEIPLVSFIGKYLLIEVTDTITKKVASYAESMPYTVDVIDKITTNLYGYDYAADKLVEIKSDVDLDNETNRYQKVQSNLFYDLDHRKFTLYQISSDLKITNITTSTIGPEVKLTSKHFTAFSSTPQFILFDTTYNNISHNNETALINLDSGSVFQFVTYAIPNNKDAFYQLYEAPLDIVQHKLIATYNAQGHYYGLLPYEKMILNDINSGQQQEVKFE